MVLTATVKYCVPACAVAFAGTYPFPRNALIEGAYLGCPTEQCSGDRHVLAIDNYTCLLYEGYHCRAPSSNAGMLTTGLCTPVCCATVCINQT